VQRHSLHVPVGAFQEPGSPILAVGDGERVRVRGRADGGGVRGHVAGFQRGRAGLVAQRDVRRRPVRGERDVLTTPVRVPRRDDRRWMLRS
jgi:hypothetical protein